MNNLKKIGLGLMALLSLASISGCYGPAYYGRRPPPHYYYHHGYWR